MRQTRTGKIVGMDTVMVRTADGNPVARIEFDNTSGRGELSYLGRLAGVRVALTEPLLRYLLQDFAERGMTFEKVAA